MIEPERVSEVQRAAAVSREPITVSVDDVDVGCALRNPLVEKPRTLVDQRKDAALDNFVVGYVATSTSNDVRVLIQKHSTGQ